MQSFRNVPLLAAGLALGLGACTALPPEKVEAIGPPFNEMVKRGYVQLASSEWKEVDVGDARHFERKARAAMLGDAVWPDKVGSRDIAPELRLEAYELRQRLVVALESSARERAPAEAAGAQVDFDCWLEGLESSPESPEISACRDGFLQGLERIELAAVEVPQEYRMLFGPGRTALDSPDLMIIDEAARAVRLIEPSRVVVVGVSDSAGSPEANRRIADRRAEVVAEALVEAGVPIEVIETNAELSGGDPARPESRRVDVLLVR